MQGVSIERLQIASVMLRDLEDFTVSSGLDYESLASAVGLGPLDSGEDAQFVNLDRFAKFLEIGSILTGDDSFGLRFAERQAMTLSGPLSFAMTNAPTVQGALLILVKYIHTRVDVASMDLVVESDRAVIEWSLSPLLVRRWQLCDYAGAAIMLRMKRIIDADWRPISVGSVRPAPKNRDVHRRILGRAIEFSQAMNSIALPTSVLAVPITGANAGIYKMSCQLLDHKLAERDATTDLVTHIREEIIQALPTENGAQLQRVSRRLGMSIRSLQRHLALEETSFRDLVDSTRMSLATRYLEDPTMTFSQIAYQLGFSAPSAFTRASYRWFGKRPGVVRQDSRRGLPPREQPRTTSNKR